MPQRLGPPDPQRRGCRATATTNLRVLREKVAAEPDNIAVRIELAKAYRDRGYPDVALEICRLAAARFPESGEAQLALVRALREVNRRHEAIAGLEAFLKAHPQTAPDYYSWLGILRDESGPVAAGEAGASQSPGTAPRASIRCTTIWAITC